MAESLGKKFEAAFKADWKHCFPDSFIYRLPDQMSGFAGGGSSNPCDFIGFTGGRLFMIECKEHKGASLPFSAIRQFDKLVSFIGLKDVYPGVLVWLSEKDVVFWAPITELKRMRENGLKSIGIKALQDKAYNIIQIPSIKKRTFMTSDYNCLLEI